MCVKTGMVLYSIVSLNCLYMLDECSKSAVTFRMSNSGLMRKPCSFLIGFTRFRNGLRSVIWSFMNMTSRSSTKTFYLCVEVAWPEMQFVYISYFEATFERSILNSFLKILESISIWRRRFASTYCLCWISWWLCIRSTKLLIKASFKFSSSTSFLNLSISLIYISNIFSWCLSISPEGSLAIKSMIKF